MTLDEAFSAYVLFCKAKGLSPRTVDYYTERSAGFRQYIGGSTDIRQITPHLMRQYIESIHGTTTPSTINHNISVVRSMFNFLVDEGCVDSNPTARIKKVRERPKVIESVQPDEVRRLVETCKKTFTDVRDRALIPLLFDTGIRVGEANGIRLGSLDLRENTLLVSGKTGERIVPFGLTTRQALNSYLARRGNLVGQDLLFVSQFGERLDHYAIGLMLRRRRKRAGIEKNIHPHMFRHGAALEMLRSGASALHVKALLGHRTLDMTERYVALNEADIRDVHRQHSPTDRLKLPTRGRKKLR